MMKFNIEMWKYMEQFVFEGLGRSFSPNFGVNIWNTLNFRVFSFRVCSFSPTVEKVCRTF